MNTKRVTAIRIKAEFAIPADVADIDQFQVAAAKANQLKALAQEVGVVVSFESKIGNVEVDDAPEKGPKPEHADRYDDRSTAAAEAAMKEPETATGD